MRKLFFTTGSPFARAVRIMLAEKGLEYESAETFTTPSVEERAITTPTLQVPMLIDGDLRLWDSTVILDYLMATYPSPAHLPGQQPLAVEYVRPSHLWHDKLLHATLQTLGASITIISQMHWSGITHRDNGFLARCAIRVEYLFDWCEARLLDNKNGLVEGVFSAQDLILVCFCQFIERRPVSLTWAAPHRQKIAALVSRTVERPSFQTAQPLWWEPGVTYADPAEVTWAATKTIYSGSTFATWRSKCS